MKTNKHVCIHGHFYQPPRENAWLEVVELQDSAAPFHDWNQRINFECYAPNTASRLMDQGSQIVDILNNYSRISFNFGPTLLSWMEKADPQTYKAILDADKKSAERFGGHGSAVAQVYNHMIMPLSNRRDKETQTIWGIRDFEHRFGRKPEGIWLAETAVDTESLEVLAENGIRYTILAHRQAKAVRKVGSEEWHQLPPDSVDSRRPYLCKLPSGKEIVLFFYHGGIAQGVAFDGLLNNGDYFAQAFLDACDDNDAPQLIHIATDGESYGHHHKHGEMALSACLRRFENDPNIELTNYGQYLDLYPVEWEAEIHENSSWSCVHGIERWRSNCGCCTGGRPGWNQEWRKPLRETLDWLRDNLIPVYEKEAGQLVKDVWAARNAYVDVILNRTEAVQETFFAEHARHPLSDAEKTKLLRLMEMQRQAMLMYTSCGWFFDEISGLETDQILQYANRAIHYARQVAHKEFHPEFLYRLEQAPSNMYENGSVSYRKNVMPASVDLVRMGMHYAASSIFEEYPEELDVFNYHAHSEVFHRMTAGTQVLAIGRTTVRSRTTLSKKHFSFAVLYLGQQNIIGNISTDMKLSVFEEMARELIRGFNSTDLGDVIGKMQEYFGSDKFSVWHLFRDEKRKILNDITQKSLESIEKAFRDIYTDNYQLMIGIQQSSIPIPEAFANAVEFILNKDLNAFFENGELNIRLLRRLSTEINRWQVPLTNEPSFALRAGERIYQEVQQIVAEGTASNDRLNNLNLVLSTLQDIGVDINFWKSQNLYYSMLKAYRKVPDAERDPEWQEAFFALGNLLGVKTEM